MTDTAFWSTQNKPRLSRPQSEEGLNICTQGDWRATESASIPELKMTALETHRDYQEPIIKPLTTYFTMEFNEK